VVIDWRMLRLWGSNTRCAFSVCVSGAVPLEGYPVRVQHLVRAPARRGRWRGVGVDLSSALFILLLQCNGLRFPLPPEASVCIVESTGVTFFTA